MSIKYAYIEFPVGTTIREACEQAKQFAEVLEICVRFDFNGVTISLGSDADIDCAIGMYYQLKEGDCISQP